MVSHLEIVYNYNIMKNTIIKAINLLWLTTFVLLFYTDFYAGIAAESHANEKVEVQSLCPLQSNLYMTNLSDKKCVPCEGGIPAFEMGEIQKYLKKVDGWEVLKDKENNFFIEKDFKFKNYVESENFVIKVGKIAEHEGHHPDILFGWGYQK